MYIAYNAGENEHPYAAPRSTRNSDETKVRAHTQEQMCAYIPATVTPFSSNRYCRRPCRAASYAFSTSKKHVSSLASCGLGLCQRWHELR